MRLGKALATGVAEERPQSYGTGEPNEGERPLAGAATGPESAGPVEETPAAPSLEVAVEVVPVAR
jgi:hypothetical protein